MLSKRKEEYRKHMARMNTLSFASQLPLPFEKINRYIVVQRSSRPTDGDVMALIDGEERGLICRSRVQGFQGWREQIECDSQFVRAIIDRLDRQGFWELNDFSMDSDNQYLGQYYLLVYAKDCAKNRRVGVETGVEATMLMPIEGKMQSVRKLSLELYRLMITPREELETRSRLFAKGLGRFDRFFSFIRAVIKKLSGKSKDLRGR